MNSSTIHPQTELSVFSLPASMIRQFCFCPRIIWFYEVKGMMPPSKVWQRQGVKYHQKQSMLAKRRNLERFGFAEAKLDLNIHLKLENGKCHGIADGILVTENKIAVVEFKLNKSAPTKGQILQAVAYGLMAQQVYNKPCPSIFMLMGERGKTYEYKLTTALREKFDKTLIKMRKILQSPIIPDSPASKEQCAQCEFFNFCGDR